MTIIRITETVEIDLDKEMWRCSHCHTEIHPARESYLNGCLVYEKPASEIYGPPIPIKSGSSEISYAPDPDFMRIVEFYCPECGAMMTVQYLPPGHPIVTEMELDIDKMKERAVKPPK
ncbi:MAG: acetone carboxylase subunit gamma [Dehalococcoidales bacterium]